MFLPPHLLVSFYRHPSSIFPNYCPGRVDFCTGQKRDPQPAMAAIKGKETLRDKKGLLEIQNVIAERKIIEHKAER